MILTISLGVLSILLSLFYCGRPNDHWKKMKVPHTTPKPFVGNTPNGIVQRRNVLYDIQFVFNTFRGQFNFVGMYKNRKPLILVLDPSIVRQVLVADFNKFADNDLSNLINEKLDPILGKNPFFFNDAAWKERRAEISPALTVSRLRVMYPLVQDVCQKLTSHLEGELQLHPGTAIEARELLAKYTTDVVASCIFSADAGSLQDPDSLIRKMGMEFIKPSARIILRALLCEICPALIKVLGIPLIPDHVEQFFTKLAKDAADARRNGGGPNRKNADVLQYLLDLQESKGLTDNELAAMCIAFFVEGFKTSSVSMSLVLFELARSERVQRKLREEICSAEQKRSELDMDTIASLEYLDQVVYEALRLNPPAPILTKNCIGDCKLPLQHDDPAKMIEITAGTTLTIPVLDIHRDPANYESPLEFKPERFDSEYGGVRVFKDKGALLVFGMGPRECLGRKFAMMQMKAGLVEIVKNFELSLGGKTKVPLEVSPYNFNFITESGIWINFKRLKGEK